MIALNRTALKEKLNLIFEDFVEVPARAFSEATKKGNIKQNLLTEVKVFIPTRFGDAKECVKLQGQ